MTIKLLSLDAALVTGVLAAYSYYIQWIVPQILAMNVMDTPVAAGKLVLPALAAGMLVWYFVKGCWTVTQHHRTLTSAGFGEAELATTPWNTSWGNVPSENRDEPPNANRLLRPRKRVCQYPPPYPNGWFFLATSDDMPKETSKYFAVMGMHIALFRDSKGKVHGIDAYCPHLGANLAVGESPLLCSCHAIPSMSMDLLFAAWVHSISGSVPLFGLIVRFSLTDVKPSFAMSPCMPAALYPIDAL
jgi:Rieske [2Fe-2S] domain